MLRAARDGTTAVWTLDNPGAKNAIDAETFLALDAAANEIAGDRTIRAVVITGAGDTFASGGDLRQLRTVTGPEETAAFREAGARTCAKLEASRVPIIAAIEGVAFGGGAELAMACDLRVAGATARISFKQVRLAVTTAWGTAERLVATVGRGTAARLLFTAHEIGADEARTIGLVDHVAPAGGALTTALAWANDVAAGAPDAVAAMKILLRAPERERDLFVTTWTSADHREAVEAFFEKRKPTWL